MKEPGRIPIAALGAALALLASFFVQLQLTAQGGEPPVDRFVQLLILGCIAGPLVLWDTGGGEDQKVWKQLPFAAPRARQASLFGGGGVVLSLLAAWMVHSSGSATGALILWLGGLVLVLVSGLVADNPHDLVANLNHRLQALRTWSGGSTALALACITIGAALLRLPMLQTVPGFIHNDEASNGLMARSVAEGQIPSLFSYGWANLPMLGYTWDGMFLKVLGDSLVSLRLSSAVLGIGSVVLVALLGTILFNPRAGLLAAALLTVFHVHLHFSRVGHHYIQALFAVELTLLLLAVSLKHGSRLAAVAAGILLSVDLQVYYAARVAYVIVPLAALAVLLGSDRRALRERLFLLAWVSLGWVVGVAPISALILGDWSDFTGRTTEVMVLGGLQDTRAHVLSVYGTLNPWYVLRTQFWMVLQTFNFRGDSANQYGIDQPMLDPMSAALLPAAFVYALLQVRRPGYAWCIIGFVATFIVGGVATIDPPFWPRLIVIVPFLALLLGAFLDGVWSVVARTLPDPRLCWLAVLAVAVVIANGNIHWYYGEYVSAVGSNFYESAPADIGTYLRAIDDRPSVYGISDGIVLVTHQAIQFLAPTIIPCDVLDGISLQHCPQPPRPDRIFVIMPGRVTLIPQLQRTYPGGTLFLLKSYSLGERLYIYRLK